VADISKTIEIIFGAVDNTGSVLSDIGSGIENSVNEISNLTGPLADIADKALLAEGAVISLGAAFLTAAVNESAQFGEKLKEIGSLINATPDQVAELRTAIQDFASNSTSNFEQIGNAVYIATSNLGDTAAALDVLAVAEAGAIVGATDLESTAALLTRTMNAYGLVTEDSAQNTENAERIMSALFATVQNGDTNMTALADNLGRVSSTAAAAGVPIEDVGASIAALTGAGVNTAESMTLLNAILKELLNPGKELAPVLQGISLETDGLKGVMDKLKEATGGSADQLLNIFSSSEAAKAAIILTNDEAGKFAGTLDKMSTATQDFKTNLDNMTGGVADSTQKLKNNATILLQEIGAPLEEGWASILDSLSAVTQGFKISIDEGSFDPVFDAFSGFEQDIADFLNRIAENLPAALEQVDFSGLIDAFADLGLEIGDLFGGVDLNTPEGLASAIQLVVDSFESLTRVVSGIVDVWGPVVQGFVAGIDAFNDLDDASRKSVGQVIGIAQEFETLKGALLGGADALQTIGDALSAIAGIQVASTIAGISAALAGPVGLAVAAGVVAGAVGYAEGTGLAAGIDELLSAVTGSETSLGSWIYDLVNGEEDLNKLATTTRDTSDSVSEFNQSLDDTAQSLDESATSVDSTAESFSWFDDAVKAVSENLGLANDSSINAANGFNTLAEAQDYLAQTAKEGNAQFIEYKDGLYQITDGGFAAADAVDKAGQSVEDAAEKTKTGSAEWKRVQDVLLDTQKVANDFRVDMQALANERYEVQVRAAVDLQTAQIEADTQRIQAAFESINQAVSSLTTGTTDLWSAFSDKAGFVGGDELEEAALRMEKRLDEELELKRQLTEAIVEQANATADRLASDTPIINIDGGQLQPELEMIFDKILEYTQIRATNEGLNLLLGV
jgi:TP901 family phage tail tape measure protein